jgi:hypothetical protein
LSVAKRILGASLLVLLALAAAVFSLWVQLDPFVGGGPVLALASAGSGAGFAVAGYVIAGRQAPRGFALVALGLSAAAATLAAIVLSYA